MIIAHRCLPALLAMSFSIVFTPPTFSQSENDDSDAENTPHVTMDPVELRKQSNARYVNVPITTRVTQRFEMYDPRTADELADLADMGFTQVILDRPELHEAAGH